MVIFGLMISGSAIQADFMKYKPLEGPTNPPSVVQMKRI